MKPIAPFLTSIAMMLSAGTGSNALPAVSGGNYAAAQLTAQEVKYYLEHCEHRHIVQWVEPLSDGSFEAGIENCGTALVYMTPARIIQHQDQSGICID